MFGDLSRRRGEEAPTYDTRAPDDTGLPGQEFRQGILDVIHAVHNYSVRPPIGGWRSHTVVLQAGVSTLIKGSNPQRSRLLIAQDVGNTATVFVTPGEFNGAANVKGAPTFPLNPPTVGPLEFCTTGDVWGICTAAAVVYVREELWAPVRSGS